MNQENMNGIMSLIFDHQLEIPEQKYIDMCNCMKELYQMHAYVNEMKENNDRLKKNLRYKGKLLIERFDELNVEKEKLKLPNINNEIKYSACLKTALENNLVNEKIHVNMNVDTNNDNDKTEFVNVRLSKRTYIGNIDISFFILEDRIFNGIMFNKNLPSCKTLKNIKRYLDNTLKDNGETYLKNVKKTREEQLIKIKHKFYADNMKHLKDQVDFLVHMIKAL